MPATTSNEEVRFTPAGDFCPHPEYWHSPDSEATETEVSEFIGALVGMIKPEFVLETGTYHGHTTYQIGLALRDNGRGQVVSIDSDRNAVATAQKNIAFFESLSEEPDLPITILHMNSMDYVPPLPIDFAFFDSWQEGRHEEFQRFWKMGLLKPNAIVAFHDTAPHHQVRKHVYPLQTMITIIDFHTPRGLILGQLKPKVERLIGISGGWSYEGRVDDYITRVT